MVIYGVLECQSQSSPECWVAFGICGLFFVFMKLGFVIYISTLTS